MNREEKIEEKNSITKIQEIEKDRFFLLSQDFFIILKFNGNLKWSNPAYKIKFEISEETEGKKSIIELIHSEDLETFQVNFGKLKSGHQVDEFEIRLKTKNDNYIYVLWDAFSKLDEGLIYAVGKDLSIQKKSEEEIKLVTRTIKAFSESDSLTGALNIALSEICNNNSVPYSEAFIKSPDAERIIRVASWHNFSKTISTFNSLSEKFSCIAGEGIIGKVWTSQSYLWINSLNSSKEFLRANLIDEAGLNTLLAVPVISNNQTMSVMVFFLYGSFKKTNR